MRPIDDSIPLTGDKNAYPPEPHDPYRREPAVSRWLSGNGNAGERMAEDR